ncbi:MAG: hypothetical protein LUG57_00225 [Oscillospiraceae bacterium]|nr:hypothetical protein [Oscillospiraceae bacterium]
MNTKLLRNGAAFLAAVLLLLALFTALIPQQAAAAPSQAELWQTIEDQSETFDGGDGTEASPYEIATADQLRRLADIINAHSTAHSATAYINACYILTADIDLGGEKNPWTPIGDGYLDSVYSFNGYFDGNGHVISGLYISVGEDDDTELTRFGLFGQCSGTICNLTLADSTINVEIAGRVGAIAGELSGGTIENCTVADDVTVSALFYAGGVTGYSALSSSLIQDCSSAAAVTAVSEAGNGNAGGIVGITVGTVSSCVNQGAVTSGSYAGGIAGQTMGSVLEDCENQGDITGQEAGGITGLVNAQQTNGTETETLIDGCVSSGSVSGADTAGGIAAHLSLSSGLITISGCENTGAVSGGSTAAAGIAAAFTGGSGVCNLTIESCENTGDVTVSDQEGSGVAAGILASATLRGGGALTLADCANTGSVTGGTLYTGGIFGEYTPTALSDEDSGVDIIFSQCVNGGDVTGGGSYGISGIAGCIDSTGVVTEQDYPAVTLTFDGCENTGYIYATGTAPVIGGILGYLNPSYCTAALTDCVNSGSLDLTEVEIEEDDQWFGTTVAVGGLVGFIGNKTSRIDLTDDCGVTGTDPVVTFQGCANEGAITSYDDGRDHLTGDLYGASVVPVDVLD